MKKSNTENMFKKEKNNPTNILEHLFFYDVNCSDANEVKKSGALGEKFFG